MRDMPSDSLFSVQKISFTTPNKVQRKHKAKKKQATFVSLRGGRKLCYKRGTKVSQREERKKEEKERKEKKRQKAPTPSFLATSVSAPCTAFSLFSGYPCFFSEVNIDYSCLDWQRKVGSTQSRSLHPHYLCLVQERLSVEMLAFTALIKFGEVAGTLLLLPCLKRGPTLS